MKTRLSDYPPCEKESLENAQPDWLAAPVGLTKKSDLLTKSNFEAMMDRLDDADPYGKDWEIVRFPHFHAGWLEAIFVRPDTKCATVISETRDQLAKYPCLDEDLWFTLEEEAREAKELKELENAASKSA